MSAINDRLATVFGAFKPGNYAGRSGRVSHGRIRGVARVIRESRIPDQITKWKEEDRLSPCGRRPLFEAPEVTVLILLLVMALEGMPLQLTVMTDMTNRLMRPKSRHELGIAVKRPVTSKKRRKTYFQWYHLYYRSLHSLLDLVDPQPMPRRETLTKIERDAYIAAVPTERRTRVLNRLNWLNNELVHLTFTMAGGLMDEWKGNLTIDATILAVSGKLGEGKDSPWAGTHEAGWYRRDAKNRYTDDRSKMVKSAWGFDATYVAAATNNDPQQPDNFPYLIVAASYEKPSMDPSGCALTAFDQLGARLAARIYGAFVTADLGYFPASKPEKLKGPMWKWGLRAHHDYRKDQLGVRGQMAGAPVIEGNPYCPAMPQDLKDAGIVGRLQKPAGEEAREAHHERFINLVDRRKIYLVKPHGKMRPDGSQRMRCPASGPNATVKCPFKPESFDAPSANMTIFEEDLPAYPDDICTKHSVTIELDTALKYRQDEQWMSKSSQRRYKKARNTIEGINGRIKDQGQDSIGDPGRRLIRGFAAQSLLASIIVFAYNLRRIDEFVLRSKKKVKPGPPRRRDIRGGTYADRIESRENGVPPYPEGEIPPSA